MMATPTLLFLYSSLFIVSLRKCAAKPVCNVSSCGIIPNIYYPFYLKGDPDHCGFPGGELECDNNVTILYLNSHKYYVKAINYIDNEGPKIRVVDSSINNHTCSFPTYSAYQYNFTAPSAYPYRVYRSYTSATAINLMSCPHPLKNSSTFIDATDCQTSDSRFTYVKIGSMMASDVIETCSVDVIVMTAWKFNDSSNVSLDDIHRSLLYGFELILCTTCADSWTAWGKFINFFYRRIRRTFLIFLIIYVISGLAVNPVMSIIAVTVLLVILMSIGTDLYYTVQQRYLWNLLNTVFGYNIYDGSGDGPGNYDFISTVVIVVGPRIIISLFLIWLLIYKFQRRHLSKSHTIERFLQSDNKLAPIRYSYSDLKKMTKNFQEKLGEGGYGFVYKGKLRSGYHVAVKVLGKSGASDKDFMNEISTIGRIHHVNIMTLAGYCAEGTKRALVLDFMPNGSLDKYIFNKEKMKSLNWDMKFGIAVGVARGIEYLHQGCNIQILHFDIKPHNILLDDKFTPKVSDFGLAKFCSTEKNAVTLTAARGTIGYVAPELINRGIGRVSHKADVYSFGMLLMDMLGLKRDLGGKNDESSKYFPCWIYDCFEQDKDIIIESVDGENDEDESIRKLVRKMTIVGLWCIQMNPEDRPSMNKVVEMLEAEVEHLRIPHYPSESPYQNEINESSSIYYDSVPLLPTTNVAITVEN